MSSDLSEREAAVLAGGSDMGAGLRKWAALRLKQLCEQLDERASGRTVSGPQIPFRALFLFYAVTSDADRSSRHCIAVVDAFYAFVLKSPTLLCSRWHERQLPP
ncbi:hypothetical protein GCM10027093_10620 [Paraburkholderia jirisanensis]